MRSADFLSLGKSTSAIGFGCGRLAGRATFRESTALVETALDLGIRYFDVAPSYGLGTAEDVLGAVIGASPEVTVATKVGLPRPVYSASRNTLRKIVKPLVGRSASLKRLASRADRAARRSAGERTRFNFSASVIRRSLEESLEQLRRDSVDVFLAHEPHPDDLNSEVEGGFRALVDDGLITTYGVGVDARAERWAPFGSIWQSGWPGESVGEYRDEVSYIFHGVLRFASETRSNRDAMRPSSLLRTAAEQRRGSILLVSASTPRHLRELLVEIE
jgi:aryl-alcohol dehydrogenase-like predicted oxidoreductase